MENSVFFVLTRHGRTAGNEKNIYRGLSNAGFAQLDENGRQDARDAAIYMKGLGMEFPVIVVDDLERTQETARIIAEVLGIKEIITDKRLRPVDVGEFTGKSKALHPLTEYMDHPSKRIPGGDTLNQFNKRQASVFGDIVEAIAKLRKDTGRPVMFLVVGHGSNASFLYHNVNKGGKEIGYEGMTEPGGIMTFTKAGIEPIFKKKKEKKQTKNGLVQIEPASGVQRWALAFVGGKDTDDDPKSCFNCPFMYANQKTCQIHGPNIIIDRVEKDGETYTPVCIYQRGGTPLKVADDKVVYNVNVLGEKAADQTGLEWAKSPTGTNCGGYKQGAPCEHFIVTDGKGVDGLCKLMSVEQDETSDAMSEHKGQSVDWDDCCDGHEGENMPWREAQKILKKED